MCADPVSPVLFVFGQSLSSEVILENSKLPEGVSINYKSICKNRVEETGENGRKCSNISIGDEVLLFWSFSDGFASFPQIRNGL